MDADEAGLSDDEAAKRAEVKRLEAKLQAVQAEVKKFAEEVTHFTAASDNNKRKMPSGSGPFDKKAKPDEGPALVPNGNCKFGYSWEEFNRRKMLPAHKRECYYCQGPHFFGDGCPYIDDALAGKKSPQGIKPKFPLSKPTYGGKGKRRK